MVPPSPWRASLGVSAEQVSGHQNLGLGVPLLSFPLWFSILRGDSCTKDTSSACDIPEGPWTGVLTQPDFQSAGLGNTRWENDPPILAARPGWTWQEQEPGDAGMRFWSVPGLI